MAATGQKLDPREHYKSLMGAVIRISPTFAELRVEKITEQIVWVERTQVLRFKHACALKFRETFEFISR
jgi:hypothetical protein